MSTVNGTVTTGYEFTLDEAGKAQVTVPRLNLLGVPTVTSDMSDSIALVDLKDAVKQLMPKLSVVAADSTGGVGTATIQIQDADSNSLTGRYLVRIWASDSDFGAPHSMTTSFLPTTGTLIAQHTTVATTAKADVGVITNASGVVVMSVQDGAGTVYIMAEINGLVVSAQLDIT